MTQDQKRTSFRAYGCVPRSLSHLSSCSLSEDEFIAKYERYFESAPRYGRLTPVGLEEIMRHLGLKGIGYSGSYSAVESAFKNGFKVMINSEIDLWPPEATNICTHASVLTAMNADEFSVWSPQQNGSSLPITLKSKWWLPKKCMGVLFQLDDK